MAAKSVVTRAADLGIFQKVSGVGGSYPFLLLDLVHIYIKLDFKSQYEHARTADDARGFLRSVARAAMAASALAAEFGGAILEVQGSMLHVGIPLGPKMPLGSAPNGAFGFCGALHQIYETVFFDRSSRVDGWRMTADGGRTLVVAGRGVHDDQSWVSLGSSANRPAKHLYAQLELPEDRRQLKRFCVGLLDPGSGGWQYRRLDELPVFTTKAGVLAEGLRDSEPKVRFTDSFIVEARATPIGPAGTPASPSPDRPMNHYGWVMRADLDGFTAKVEECDGEDHAMTALADGFYEIMDKAAKFTALHDQELVQLPWAGDNFTAMAVFRSKSEYDRAVPRRLVETSLDFEKEMADAAANAGFGGWAYGVAGGEVGGVRGGNVYFAGIEIDGRRFLVAAGEGVGRSAQAFGDVNPKAKQVVLYSPDFERLHETYREHFKVAKNVRGEESSLYRVSATPVLVAARAGLGAVGAVSMVSVSPSTTRLVEPRPHFS